MKPGDKFTIEFGSFALDVVILRVSETTILWKEIGWFFTVKKLESLDAWNRRLKIKL